MEDENEFVQVALMLMRRQIDQIDRLKQPLGVRTRMGVIRIAVDRLYASFFSQPCPVEHTDVNQAGEPTT